MKIIVTVVKESSISTLVHPSLAVRLAALKLDCTLSPLRPVDYTVRYRKQKCPMPVVLNPSPRLVAIGIPDCD